jgi:hypothetical protein
MKLTLSNAMSNMEIVSVYTDYNTDSFSAGYILGVYDDFVLLNSITPNGLNDGLYILKLENIFQVNFNGDYELKLKSYIL